MVEEKKDQFCLVLCPVGPAGSPKRDRMNGIFHEVIKPVVEEFGYRAEVAIHGKNPDIVTESIVTMLIEADVVIVDLHGHDGNVMYGMAIRHATGAPIVQMVPEGEGLPFDVAGSNTVTYDFSVHRLDQWRKDLATALRAVADGRLESNPVARASLVRGLQTFAKTSMFAGLQAQVGGRDVAPVDFSPPVERARDEGERPGLLWNSSVSRSGWMSDLQLALASHSLAGLLDSFKVDLEEVENELILVSVYSIGDDRSDPRMISTYKTRGFEEDSTDVADRILARLDRDLRRMRNMNKSI